MTASRPIGERIRELCECLNVEGPMGIAGLLFFMPHVKRSNLGKYCSRAVKLGLLTVDRRQRRQAWTVVPNWRELIEQRRTTRIKPIEQTPPAKQTRWNGVSSVFQMGTQ